MLEQGCSSIVDVGLIPLCLPPLTITVVARPLDV